MFWPLEHPVSLSRYTSSAESIFSAPEHSPTSVCIHNDTIWTPSPRASHHHILPHLASVSVTLGEQYEDGRRRVTSPILTSVRYTCCLVLRSSLPATRQLVVAYRCDSRQEGNWRNALWNWAKDASCHINISFVLEGSDSVIRSHHSPQRAGFDSRPVYKCLGCKNWK